MNAAMSAFRSYRDDHGEPLEVHLEQGPRTGRITGLGQTATFRRLRVKVGLRVTTVRSSPASNVVGFDCGSGRKQWESGHRGVARDLERLAGDLIHAFLTMSHP